MKLFSRSLWPQLAVLLLVCSAAFSSYAQSVRVGAINVDRILRDSAPAKAAQTKLEQEFSRRDREITTQINQFTEAVQVFERESPTMAAAQRSARQRELAETERELQRKRRAFEEDLGARRAEETQSLIERVNRVIRQIAEAEKYDLIVQEAAYINPAIDITDKVLAALNAQR